MIGSIRPETRDGPVRLMTITLLKTSTSFSHHPRPSLMPQSCSLPLDVGVSTGVWPKRVHVLVLVGVFSFANPAGNTAVLNYYKRTKKRFLLGVLRVFLALTVISTIFPPIYIQHNKCPCRCPMEKRALWAQIARQRFALRIQQGDFAMQCRPQ